MVLSAISLCSGYEGIGKGLALAGVDFRILCYVEREAFATANLVAKIKQGRLDDAPIWSDVATFDCDPWIGKVDIITGGYPCAPFSQAGKRKGKDDPRHLWPHIRRIVESIRPVYVFLENVGGHVTLGLSSVISDLGEMGYRTTFGLFTASEVGAPHQRKRVFILGIADSQSFNLTRLRKMDGQVLRQGKRQEGEHMFDSSSELGYSRGAEPHGIPKSKRRKQNLATRGAGELADARKQRGQRGGTYEKGSAPHGAIAERRDAWTARQSPCKRRGNVGVDKPTPRWPARQNEPQHDWEPPRVTVSPWNHKVYARYLSINPEGISERENKILTDNGWIFEGETFTKMGRDLNEPGYRLVRSTSRTDELRLLGNGVVPAQVARACTVLMERFK